MLLFTPLIGPKRHFATTVSSFRPCAFHVNFLASRPEKYSTDAQRWLNAAGKCKIVHYWGFRLFKVNEKLLFFFARCRNAGFCAFCFCFCSSALKTSSTELFLWFSINYQISCFKMVVLIIFIVSFLLNNPLLSENRAPSWLGRQ